MSALGWALVGAGSVSVVGVLFFAVTERGFREALVQVFGALVAGPALLFGLWVRSRSPRLMRLSPEALSLFARQQTGLRESAWLLGYRGRGVIVVRRASGTSWQNDVPNRANRARHDTAPRRTERGTT